MPIRLPDSANPSNFGLQPPPAFSVQAAERRASGPACNKCLKIAGIFWGAFDSCNDFVFKNLFSAKALLSASLDTLVNGSLTPLLAHQSVKFRDFARYGGFSLKASFNGAALKYKVKALGICCLCLKELTVNSLEALFFSAANLTTLFLSRSLRNEMQKKWWQTLFSVNALALAIFDVVSRKLSLALSLIPSLVFLYYNFVAFRAYLLSDLWRFYLIEYRGDIQSWVDQAATDAIRQERHAFTLNLQRIVSLKHLLETIAASNGRFFQLAAWIIARQLGIDPRTFSANSLGELVENLCRLPNLREAIAQANQIFDLSINPREDLQTLKAALQTLNQNLTAEHQALLAEKKAELDPAYIAAMAKAVTFIALSEKRNTQFIKNNPVWENLCRQYDLLESKDKDDLKGFFQKYFFLLLEDKTDRFMKQPLEISPRQPPLSQKAQEKLKQNLARIMVAAIIYSNNYVLQGNSVFNALVAAL
ncbi:MAG: hypothetical protein WC371_02235 [Parachlamydiales bacterium]|jgi:hypothetical protein